MDSCFHLSGRYGGRTVDSTFLTAAADEVMPRLGPAAVPRCRSRHLCAIFSLRQPKFFEILLSCAGELSPRPLQHPQQITGNGGECHQSHRQGVDKEGKPTPAHLHGTRQLGAPPAKPRV